MPNGFEINLHLLRNTCKKNITLKKVYNVGGLITRVLDKTSTCYEHYEHFEQNTAAFTRKSQMKNKKYILFVRTNTDLIGRWITIDLFGEISYVFGRISNSFGQIRICSDKVCFLVGRISFLFRRTRIVRTN